MIKIDIKPLSVNDAWKGRRFRTDEYKKYQRDCNLLLRKLDIPDGRLKIHFEWGFSSAGSDCGNPEKPFMDILSKKFGFNDNRVYREILDKVVVKKGEEYIKFKIEKWEE